MNNEFKVTWGFAWSLWWRWFLISMAAGILLYGFLFLFFLALGIALTF
jgi:hypothetical protein